MTPEQAAELAATARTTATSLVARVHTESPEVIWAHLAGLGPAHLVATTVVLAAMVPLSASPDELLAWIEAAPSAGLLHESHPDPTDLTERSPAPMQEPDPETAIPDSAARAAQRVVAAHATDTADAQLLLAMLGIDAKVAA